MYKHSQEGKQDAEKQRRREEADHESRQAYKNDEELKKEFEEWKRSATTQYDEEKHDEFLKNRYYKMRGNS